jgi:hypothetical protein
MSASGNSTRVSDGAGVVGHPRACGVVLLCVGIARLLLLLLLLRLQLLRLLRLLRLLSAGPVTGVARITGVGVCPLRDIGGRLQRLLLLLLRPQADKTLRRFG